MGVDARGVLDGFDEEMRRSPPAETGVTVQDGDGVVRIVGDYNCVIYSDLDEHNADSVIAAQTAHFRQLQREVEWKVYGHDRPSNLGERLRLAGYHPDPTETFLVWDLKSPIPVPQGSESIEVRRVHDLGELETAIRVSEKAFGPGHSWGPTDWSSRLKDPSFAAFVAYRSGVPVGSGRLWLPPDRSFASIWGGGTVPERRGQGVFRTLVSVRAELARQKGYRYLTVDALDTSRPIFERLGFVPLDTVTGWVLRPASI